MNPLLEVFLSSHVPVCLSVCVIWPYTLLIGFREVGAFGVFPATVVVAASPGALPSGCDPAVYRPCLDGEDRLKMRACLHSNC